MHYDPRADTVRHDDGTPVDLTDAKAAKAAHTVYVTHLIDADRRRTRRVRVALVLLAVGALIVASFIGATRAKADTEFWLETTVSWYGTDCIMATDPSRNYAHVKLCNSPVIASIWAVPGQTVGLDPHMGDAYVMACTVSIDGQINYTDSATAGDGTDVNCIREVYIKRDNGFGRIYA